MIACLVGYDFWSLLAWSVFGAAVAIAAWEFMGWLLDRRD